MGCLLAALKMRMMTTSWRSLGTLTVACEIILPQWYVHKAQGFINDVIFVKQSNLEGGERRMVMQRFRYEINRNSLQEQEKEHMTGSLKQRRTKSQLTFTGSTPFQVNGPAFQLKTGFKSSSTCAARHQS
jgi:hypothetical protein